MTRTFHSYNIQRNVAISNNKDEWHKERERSQRTEKSYMITVYYIGLKTETVESQDWLYLQGRADWRGMRGLWGQQ